MNKEIVGVIIVGGVCATGGYIVGKINAYKKVAKLALKLVDDVCSENAQKKSEESK